VLVASCLTKSLSCKVVVLIRDAVYFRKMFQDVQRRLCADSNSEKSNPKILSGQPSHASERPSTSRSRTVQGRNHPNVMATRSDTLQSSRRIRVFLHRHIYGKTTASVRTTRQHRPDEVHNKARRGEELQPFGRQGNTVRTRSLLWKLRAAELQPSEC